jgi:hypothetical protein
MVKINSSLALAGMVVGFMFPSWLFHTLTHNKHDTVDLLVHRNTRSIEETASKALFQITMQDTDYLSEKYFTELDKVTSCNDDKKENYLFLEIMDQGRETSAVSWSTDFKHKRHIWTRSRDNKEYRTEHVINRLCYRKSRDRYSWTVLVDNMTYVNMNMLHHFLQRIPTSVPVLIGRYKFFMNVMYIHTLYVTSCLHTFYVMSSVYTLYVTSCHYI